MKAKQTELTARNYTKTELNISKLEAGNNTVKYLTLTFGLKIEYVKWFAYRNTKHLTRVVVTPSDSVQDCIAKIAALCGPANKFPDLLGTTHEWTLPGFGRISVSQTALDKAPTHWITVTAEK